MKLAKLLVNALKVDEIKTDFELNNKVNSYFHHKTLLSCLFCLIFLKLETFSDVLLHIVTFILCSVVWLLPDLFLNYGT
jgi:hypothetical protein